MVSPASRVMPWTRAGAATKVDELLVPKFPRLLYPQVAIRLSAHTTPLLAVPAAICAATQPAGRVTASGVWVVVRPSRP